MLEVRLKPSFRYVHEPLPTGEDALPWLGNEPIGGELQSRLLHSRGGTFLITGFRGVGKSTMVLRALNQMLVASVPGDVVLPVWLSVARSTTTERLLFAVVRRVFEALADSQVLARLSPETRHALLVAYMRTSLAFKETQSEARERSAGLDVGIGTGSVPVVNVAVPKVSMSSKRSHALATEAAFLAYSETDAEYDLMRIISLVGRESLAPPATRSWLRRLVRHRPRELRRDTRLRLVVILDEVDKLTAEDAGLGAVENLLSGAKNVLTMPGAHFLIVAGPDLHDRAVRDAARGSGVYESVFGWRMYVPCLWEAPETLISDVVSLGTSDTANASAISKQLEPLIRYLRFKARGIPRRLLQEFNSFVFWEQGSPVLRITDADMQRIEFYARLEEIMGEYFERTGQTRLFPVQIDEDRWRLGGYYVTDWALRSEGEPFSAADLFRDDADAGFDPLLRISHRGAERLLDHLADRGILEVVRSFDVAHTIIGDVDEAGATVYRLAEDVRHVLFGLAFQHETERAVLDLSVTMAPPSTVFAPDSESAVPESPGEPARQGPEMLQPPPIRVLGDRYELTRLLGQGGMGSVYAGTDRLTGQLVAVKMLRSSMADDPQAVLRVHREAEFARRLSHPQLVRTLDVTNDGPEGSPVLVMELLDGPTLSRRIESEGPMGGADAAEAGAQLAGALGYLASEGIARIDLKPSNVIIQPGRGPVIIDLGVARGREQPREITNVGMIVGTPMYMAPELVRGDRPDSRADIYSLGLVLYYCVAGRSPWEHLTDLTQIMYAIVNQGVDVSGLPISPEFAQVIERASERDAGSRFQTAADMLKALTSTPEWQTRQQAIIRSRNEASPALPDDPAGVHNAMLCTPTPAESLQSKTVQNSGYRTSSLEHANYRLAFHKAMLRGVRPAAPGTRPG